MKSSYLILAAALFSSCSNGPPRPRHLGAEDYMGARSSSEYVGESQEHAFRRKPDGAVIYTDTADLPPAEQAKVRAADKAYSGDGSRVRRH